VAFRPPVARDLAFNYPFSSIKCAAAVTSGIRAGRAYWVVFGLHFVTRSGEVIFTDSGLNINQQCFILYYRKMKINPKLQTRALFAPND
jgi:hypothetical protein